MIEYVGSIVTAIKNAGPPIYAAAFIASGLLLFLPPDLIAQMGLSEIKLSYQPQLGLALIASASLLMVHGVMVVAGASNSRLRKRRFDRRVRESLMQLTSDEKEFLGPFTFNGDNSVYAGIHDGVANGLAAKNIIYRASNMSVPGTMMAFPWNLQAYARAALEKNPSLLQ